MNYQIPQEGERIGSGVVVGLVSSGGSAHVFKTWNESLELHRAVKVISPSAEPDVFDRFATEARISSKLHHPNIVQCFNTGTTSGNLPFLEMEYISGPSVEDLIRKRGALPLPVALALSASILEALSYAHSVRYTLYERPYVGLVHRDLKPSNIVIASDGSPKLMDFGIARPIDVSFHTQQGTVPGTIAYMSPEACAGSDIDFRSDIYQFGLCLYEFLSGAMAFPQSDLTSLLKAKTRNEYAPIDSLVKRLDPRIATVIKKCLQLKPEDRYPSVKACLSAIQPLLTTVSPHVDPRDLLLAFIDDKPLPVHRARSFSVPRPVAIGLAASLALAAAALSFYHFSPLLIPFIASAFVRPPTSSPLLQSVDTTAAIDTPAVDSSAPAQPSVHRPRPTRATRTVSRQRPIPKPIKAVNTPPKGDTVPSSDALYHIKQGKKLYQAGDYTPAFDAFQTALRTPSDRVSRQSIVQQSVYWSAKCNTALFRAGSCPSSNFSASWRSVKAAFAAGTPQHTEAITFLKEVGE